MGCLLWRRRLGNILLIGFSGHGSGNGRSILNLPDPSMWVWGITQFKVGKVAIWACGVDKPLGFDGYNFKFFREIWDEVKLDIFSFVYDFMRTEKFQQAINMTWVAFIPKIIQAVSVDDFRPISMVGTLYKITSKLLSMILWGGVVSIFRWILVCFRNWETNTGWIFSCQWGHLMVEVDKEVWCST